MSSFILASGAAILIGIGEQFILNLKEPSKMPWIMLGCGTAILALGFLFN